MRPTGLAALQRQWDAWGRKDALWAALTRGDKWGRRWDAAEFMRTGQEEIDLVLRHLSDLGAVVPPQRALDFGCGVGRYAQAMAERFERVDGVDIAPSMLRQARRLNRHPGRCVYHLNARDDLSLFPDVTFSFVYSMLVLQHVGPEYARGYVAEFLRVLAPGGALVFQVPSEVPASYSRASPRAARRDVRRAMPAGSFRALIATDARELSVKAGERFPVVARIENVSAHAWPSVGSGNTLFHVQLANRWLGVDGEVLTQDDSRMALPFDLPPGGAVTLQLFCAAPPAAGEYLLELDLVQEGVAWFQEHGSPTVRICCRVSGPASPAAESWAAARRRQPLFAGFRGRHPAAHRALQALGLVRLYRSGMARLRRLAKRRQHRPVLVMEMHALPPPEVERIIADGGGVLLETETERWPNGIVSARYWVVKRE